MAAKKTTRKPRVTVDPNETRDQKFIRLANKRVNRVIKDLALVGNLGSYPHSEEQAELVMTAIQQYVDALSIKIAPRVAKSAETFAL